VSYSCVTPEVGPRACLPAFQPRPEETGLGTARPSAACSRRRAGLDASIWHALPWLGTPPQPARAGGADGAVRRPRAGISIHGIGAVHVQRHAGNTAAPIRHAGSCDASVDVSYSCVTPEVGPRASLPASQPRPEETGLGTARPSAACSRRRWGRHWPAASAAGLPTRAGTPGRTWQSGLHHPPIF